MQARTSKRATETLRGGTISTEHDLLDVLAREVEAGKTRRAVAQKFGVSDAYLNDVMRGRRGAGERIAAGLGFKRVVVFVKGN